MLQIFVFHKNPNRRRWVLYKGGYAGENNNGQRFLIPGFCAMVTYTKQPQYTHCDISNSITTRVSLYMSVCVCVNITHQIKITITALFINITKALLCYASPSPPHHPPHVFVQPTALVYLYRYFKVLLVNNRYMAKIILLTK